VVSAASEPPAAAETVALASLADRTFLLFPRELAPRLHDVLVGVCRRAGFEPKIRSESFHTSWDLDLFSESSVVALAPQSVAAGLGDGVAAVPLSEPADELETRLVWRADDLSPALEAFRSIAGAVY
jgi:DNA-binding transcriptional LysR family regulator